VSTAAADDVQAARRGPGRPRDDDLDDQILAAALALIDADEPVTVVSIVRRSGVSRAALYRRWPSLTALVAAALDVGRVIPPRIPIEGDLREAVLASFLGGQSINPGYTEARFRQRIRLAMADRELQRAYWNSHVSRRRAGLEQALRGGIASGVLRSDLDPVVCFDLLAGVFYYQLVVRGDRPDEPVVQARCRAAFEIAWRGMTAT
jgi:AcrR family transcriptional regulator